MRTSLRRRLHIRQPRHAAQFDGVRMGWLGLHTVGLGQVGARIMRIEDSAPLCLNKVSQDSTLAHGLKDHAIPPAQPPDKPESNNKISALDTMLAKPNLFC
jgi:hypothetical protein